MIRLDLPIARWLAAIVIGSTLILLGAIMLFIPGPGIVTMFGGLVVLSSEVVWARTLLKKIRERVGYKVSLPDEDKTDEKEPG